MSSPSNFWVNVGLASGLLTDEDILTLGSRNLLVTKNFEPSQVHQTCYELRVGEVAYFLLREETERKCEVDEDNPIIMRPGDVVTIITYEEIQLPDDILGRIISKGHLFSIGLSPVITFVDPGFSGNLGITFINHSKRTIKFEYKESICKIEFEKLGKKVKNPYKGQHNFADKIWPIDYSKLKSKRKLTIKEVRDNELLYKEAEFYGEPFDMIMEAIIDIKKHMNIRFRYFTTLFIGILIYISLYIIFDIFNILPQYIKNELASFIASIIIMAIKIIIEKITKKI